MTRMRTSLTALALLSMSAAPALAQEAEGVVLTIVQNEEFDQAAAGEGQISEYEAWLADQDGRAVYLFNADTQGESYSENIEETAGEPAPEVTCTGECLEAWPPVYTEGEPKVEGEGLDPRLVGTVEHDGQMMVTYNGWPLYYYAQDEASAPPQGHAVEAHGGTWYVVNADPMFASYQ